MSAPCRPRLGALLGALGLASLAWSAAAAPTTPSDDNQVLQTLPARIGSIGDDARAAAAARRAERAERMLQRSRPADLGLALSVARAAIDRARQLGDPRELGQAQAALAVWWAQAAPPAPVRLLRATVHQSQHDFSSALVDLDALLAAPKPSAGALAASRYGAAPPDGGLALRAQAELTRAAILQVLGRYAEAGAACQRLAGSDYAALGPAIQTAGQACLAELQSLQGQPARAARTLDLLAQRGTDGQPPDLATVSWLTLMRAELAERRGRPEAGELYRQACAGAPAVYALAAYADWLLDQGQPAKVLKLLAGRDEADALLLRRAIALQRLHDPTAASAADALQARFDAARVRGDFSHGREQSRYALEVRQDPRQAWALAEANWQVQKEPADALVLRRAAQAALQAAGVDDAGRAEAQRSLAALNDWARRSGWQDARWTGAAAGLASRSSAPAALARGPGPSPAGVRPASTVAMGTIR